jgi:hypothetical protein
MQTHWKLHQAVHKAIMIQRTEGKEVCGGIIGINDTQTYTHTHTHTHTHVHITLYSSPCVQFLYPGRLLAACLSRVSLHILCSSSCTRNCWVRDSEVVVLGSKISWLGGWASQWRPQLQKWSICHHNWSNATMSYIPFLFCFVLFCLGTDVVYLYMQYFVQPYISAVADTEDEIETDRD